MSDRTINESTYREVVEALTKLKVDATRPLASGYNTGFAEGWNAALDEARAAIQASGGTPPAAAGAAIPDTEALAKAARDAATSLETISQLAGRKSYGDPPIPTFMEDFANVRGYAANRAKVAREAILAASPDAAAGEKQHG